ncbi:nucleoside-triphosphatase [Psychroserpens mesophilus]|uniref:nucleoside-triphosphatase n=1 Tax=Psychroserpens mesophilus TaxID=325473 RepID=UPI003D6601CE
MIYILTGAIRTGKTTALLNWINNRNDVNGLLCPDNDSGTRYFLKVKSNETFDFEVENNHEGVINIGNFKFLKSAFKKANNDLLSMASEKKTNYLIIDELGKLELKNEGLHYSVKILMPTYINNDTHHLIVVVREYLLKDILQHYAISKYSILKKEDLKSLL